MIRSVSRFIVLGTFLMALITPSVVAPVFAMGSGGGGGGGAGAGGAGAGAGAGGAGAGGGGDYGVGYPYSGAYSGSFSFYPNRLGTKAIHKGKANRRPSF